MNKKELESLKKQFGRTALEIRQGKELSLRDVELECGLDNSKISKIEKGKINITFSTIVDLARGLGVHPSALLKGEYDWL